MILRSIELEEFGKFRGQSFELRRGTNLVFGPNEAGKSTLVEAIPAVLFGCRDSGRFKPWGKNACAARLVFEGGGRTVEIRRDLLSDEVHLVERDDLYHVLTDFRERVPFRGRGAVARKYRELLARLVGIGDEELFRATCFFGHHPQEWRGDELARKLRELLGGGSAEQDYERIMDSLLDEHFALTRINPWGRDKQQDRQLELLDKELAERQAEATGPTAAAADSQDDVAARIAVLRAEIQHDQAEYDKGLRYVEQVRARIAEQVEPAPAGQAPPASGVSTDAQRLAERLAEAGLPATLPPQTPELLGEAAAIRQDLAELQQPLVRLQQRQKDLKKPSWPVFGGVGLLLALAAGIVWFFDLFLPWSLTALMLVLVALTVCGGWLQWTFRRARAACESERDRLEQQRASALSRQELLGERCEALGLPSSAIDLVRLQKMIAQHRDLLEELWDGTGQATCTAHQSTPLQAAQTAVAEQAGADCAQSDHSDNNEAAELAELERRLAEFRQQLDERQAELARLQTTSRPAPVAGCAQSENLHELETRREVMQERVAVLRQAIELLAEAVEGYVKSDLVQLVDDASRLFQKLTGGRYPEVRLDHRMHPELRIDERRWQPIERFSRGTIDALYLALRVALARVRGDGRSLPLVLDDPFAHLDQQRFTGALKMVGLAAVQGQLILLGHNQELARRAAKERWHVVALGSTPSAQAEMEEADHDGQLHLL